ncbi:MAG: phosphoribosylamine--glycine ligase [Actinobacteria bacterium]|nr:phosphoribosylamine--glycine ligase [Actinomycetota bacterium]
MGRNVLVVGGGGREHALAWRLAASSSVDAVESTPGNPGTAAIGRTHDIDVEDPAAVAELAERRGADLVVIGPEAPLVAGVADELLRRDIPVFGPTADGARIEGSKAFAKEVMAAAGVPTAGYVATADREEAQTALERSAPPYVVKADGLAAGKGVSICDTLPEAREAVDDLLVRRRFGDAGDRVVIEEFLHGPEVSVFGVCDGEDVVLLSPAQDFKRAEDGDAGPNTGGMGAFTPVPGFGLPDAGELSGLVFRPVLRELAARGTPYRGVLYAGLVLTDGGPKLLEFNARFGDPETQIVLRRLGSDLGDLLAAAATGRVRDVRVRWHDDAFVGIVLASGGYPGAYRTGLPITGVDEADAREGVKVFHAGTARAGDGTLVTSGGRVLNVTGRGATIADAREVAYEAADRIRWDGLHRREDIALTASRA